MHIIDRFSSHVRDILARSIQLASDLKNPAVEPIHLFFVLSNQKGSIATELLTRYKISPKTVEQAIMSLPVIPAQSALPEATENSAPKTSAQQTLTPLGNAVKTILEKALVIAHEHKHSYVGSEHMLLATVRHADNLIMDVLKVNGVNVTDLEQQLINTLTNTSRFPELADVSDVVDHLEETLENMTPPPESSHDHEHHHPPTTPAGARKKESALDFFATNLTAKEAQKNIDPVIGRDKEIERVIHILCRRTKNNPLLLGEPGVGKTAIAEGLAKRISAGEVPDLLLNKKVYALDMGLLIAGTIYRGEFEGRLRQVIEEVVNDQNIILFIDEIHNIVGAGSNQGTMDASNLLKPALARGQIRCIGATTPAEYKKYIESDAALERRFQPVTVKEPSVKETIEILAGIKDNYQLYHQVNITPGALAAAARLSDRYISNKFLPDKAIDILDETAAAKRLTFKTPAAVSKIWRLEQRLEQTILAKETAAKEDRFKDAVELKKKEETLRAQIKSQRHSLNRKRRVALGTIDERDVQETLAKIIGTSPAELLIDDPTNLTKLADTIGSRLVGQATVVKEVAELIRQAKLGLSNPDRPLASFLFVGESGVGKTELAKILADVLYHDKDSLIKLDMSEFNESFGVSKLLGSPAGYVGYKESNQFTDKLKHRQHCIILFDEIDKAHRDVTKLLLQMLENGEITDAAGKKISLRHAIVILTTTLGSEILKKGILGFGEQSQAAGNGQKRLIEKLKEHFSTEVINRLDKICFFQSLTPDDLAAIAELEINRLNERLIPYQTAVRSSRQVLNWLITQLPTKSSGARDLRRLVRSEIEKLVADNILKKNLKQNYSLAIQNNILRLK